MDELELVAEATKRSGVLWLALPGLPQPRAAWHVWRAGSAYLVTGEGEQPLPGLAEAGTVEVIVRSKDKGGRLVGWRAAVGEIRPGTPEWDDVVPILVKERLNAADLPGLAARWATGAYVLRLTPTGEVTQAPGRQKTEYAVVRPVPTPATTVPGEQYGTGTDGQGDHG